MNGNIEKLIKMYAKDVCDKITNEGVILGFYNDGDDDIGLRQRLWVAYSLYAVGMEKKANAIIEKLKFSECHFSPMICLQIIKKYHKNLSDKSYQVMIDYISESIQDMIDNPEFEFVGVNDNFPCMACYSAIIGGEYTNNEEAVIWGKKNLKSLLNQLERRGINSEHTSPTYTPIQVLALAELANFTESPEVREQAIYAERRIEYSLLSFYHSTTGKISGPYSRAYTVDSVAAVHMIDFWYYVVMGKYTISVVEEMFDSEKINPVMHGSRWFETVQFVWLALCDYHVPSKWIDEAVNRNFPYEVKLNCEYSSSKDDIGDGKTEAIYSATSNEISCFMTEEYTVGISRVPFHSGIQTDSFHLICRRKEKVEHSRDIQSIYLRYIVNDNNPITNDIIWDRGRKIGFMNKNIGIIGYRPTKRIVGEKVTSLKLSIVIPNIYGDNVQILNDNKDIFIRIYNTFVYFHALHGDGEIVIEEIKDFTLISFYNYKGSTKLFDEEMYYRTVNGLAFAVSDASKESFEEFIAKKAIIKDELISTPHSRDTVLRKIRFEYDDKSIETEYDVECQGVMYSLTDGKIEKEKYYYDSIRGNCNEEDLRRIMYE